VLPGLAVTDRAASSFRLIFDQPRLLALAKLDLSSTFADGCVEKLRRAETAGDRLEWYQTVVAAAVARGMTFEVEWRSGLDSDLRASIEAETEDKLGRLTADRPGDDGGDLATAARVRVSAKNERKTVLRAELPVVLGYRARPLQYEAAEVAAGTSASLLALAAAATAATGDDDLRGVFVNPQADRFVGRLAVQLQQPDGSWSRVEVGYPFHTGDRFRFEVESAQAASLFVFHRPPGGEVGELWPGETGHAPQVESGRSRLVPTPPAVFELDGEAVRETFFVALARAAQRIADEESLGNYVLRGIRDEDADTRGVSYEADPWLYFEPSADEDEYLAAVGFQLRLLGGAGE